MGLPFLEPPSVSWWERLWPEGSGALQGGSTGLRVLWCSPFLLVGNQEMPGLGPHVLCGKHVGAPRRATPPVLGLLTAPTQCTFGTLPLLSLLASGFAAGLCEEELEAMSPCRLVGAGCLLVSLLSWDPGGVPLPCLSILTCWGPCTSGLF